MRKMLIAMVAALSLLATIPAVLSAFCVNQPSFELDGRLSDYGSVTVVPAPMMGGEWVVLQFCSECNNCNGCISRVLECRARFPGSPTNAALCLWKPDK